MYKFNKSICLERTSSPQWKNIDLRNVLVSEAFRYYSRFFLELQELPTGKVVFVDSDDIKSLYRSQKLTFVDLLVSLGDTALQVTTKPWPSTTIRYAMYSDAIQAGYMIEPANAGYRFDPIYPDELVRDIRITRPGYNIKMSSVFDNCLVSVNGFYHLTDTNGEALYVYGGNTNRRNFGDNHVGLLSFSDIGTIKCKGLKPEDILKSPADEPLRNRTYIRVNEDITNKSVFLVLGGYLIFQRDTKFWQNSEKTFALNFSSIPLMEMYHESIKNVDLTEVSKIVRPDNTEDVSVEAFYSDEAITAYLLSKQTFIVIVDTPSLFSRLLPLAPYKTPGIFSTPNEPVYPLICGSGRVSEYWKAKDNDKWNIYSSTPFKFNRTYAYDKKRATSVLSPKCVSTNRLDYSNGALLEIGGY